MLPRAGSNRAKEFHLCLLGHGDTPLTICDTAGVALRDERCSTDAKPHLRLLVSLSLSRERNLQVSVLQQSYLIAFPSLYLPIGR